MPSAVPEPGLLKWPMQIEPGRVAVMDWRTWEGVKVAPASALTSNFTTL